MATQRILTDQDFGRIVIRTRRTARNISMRVRPEGLFLIVPPYNRVDKILEAIKPFRPDLLENFRKVAVRRIDLGFSIRTECFRLSLAPSKLRCFTVREEEEGMKIYCPADTDFGREDVQKLVRNAIVRALKNGPKHICLPCWRPGLYVTDYLIGKSELRVPAVAGAAVRLHVPSVFLVI